MSAKETVVEENSGVAYAPALQGHLFADADLKTYAVLDGASIPGLLNQLSEKQPEHACLYRGEIPPDLAECAPYLVRLDPQADFTQWVLENGWGKHWGVFAVTSADLHTVRKHFRTFLVVKSPEGKRLYFRYYDPRVLRVYLPTCNPDESKAVFGPVLSYFCEESKPQKILRFRREDGAVVKAAMELTA